MIQTVMLNDVGDHYEVILALLNMAKLYQLKPEAFLPVSDRLYDYGRSKCVMRSLEGKCRWVESQDPDHVAWLKIYDSYKEGLMLGEDCKAISRSLLKHFTNHFELPKIHGELEDVIIFLLKCHTYFWQDFFRKNELELVPWKLQKIKMKYEDGNSIRLNVRSEAT
jgi:hypothetical protein